MIKKRTFAVVLLALFLLAVCPVTALAEPEIKVKIDNNTLIFDVQPIIMEGRTLVPLRLIFEGLGAKVEWDSKTQTITGTSEDTTVVLQVDNTQAEKNGQIIDLDVPATIIENRTLVPVRFIAEALGAEVNWLESSRTVEIISNQPYDLTKYYILESQIRQLAYLWDEEFYNDLAATIINIFNRESFLAMEAHLRRSYQPQQEGNGIFIGPTAQKNQTIQGIYEWESGSKYVGEWFNNLMNGEGIYFWPDGGSYIGEWQDNRRNGWGVLTSSDGDIYVGEWVDDNMEGYGVYYWEDGESYIGQWKADQRHGLGSYTWSDGNTYIGQLENGSLNGLGMFTWYDGEIYLGQHQNGLKEGLGSYYWRPDFVFHGEFADDLRTWGTYQGPEGQLLNLRENAQSIVDRLITPEMNPREKLKTLHDYVVLTTRYDKENFLSGTIPAESHTAYGAFINNVAVCDGYTEALHTLLQLAGIDSRIVVGEAKSQDGWVGHAWLIVHIDNHYYHVDVTWADPDQGDLIYYDYFLASDLKFFEDHNWDITKYPRCL